MNLHIRFNQFVSTLALRLWLPIARLAALAFFVLVAGCAKITTRPELYPDNWAPQSSDREWTPSPAVASHYTIGSTTDRLTSPATTPLPKRQTYDLVALIDIALRNNPKTWQEWEAARSAAAAKASPRLRRTATAPRSSKSDRHRRQT